MSLRQLNYIVTLAESGSFRQAAENLNITHAALVHSIRALEEQYGARLFDRGRGVKAVPTKAGEVFINHARKILLHENDLEYDIQVLKKPGLGLLNLVLGPFPLEMSGKATVNRMMAIYPDLHVKMSIRQFEQVKIALLKRQADIAVAELSNVSGHPELDTESLGNHRAGFFCRPGHPLVQKKPLTIDDLLDFPWCCTRMPSRIGDFLPTDLKRAGRYDPVTSELIPAIEVESMAGLTTLISNTDVLYAAPLVMLKKELAERDMALLPYHDSWMVTNYGFITLKNRSKAPEVEKFMEELRVVERELFIKEQELLKIYFVKEPLKKTSVKRIKALP
jgi:DNA-binding transcriptional LysR family regulator